MVIACPQVRPTPFAPFLLCPLDFCSTCNDNGIDLHSAIDRVFLSLIDRAHVHVWCLRRVHSTHPIVAKALIPQTLSLVDALAMSWLGAPISLVLVLILKLDWLVPITVGLSPLLILTLTVLLLLILLLILLRTSSPPCPPHSYFIITTAATLLLIFVLWEDAWHRMITSGCY